MRAMRVLSTAAAALRPSITEDLSAFAAARAEFLSSRPVPTTVAVVGLTPDEGRTTVAALLALSVAGWSGRRVTVLDAVATAGPRSAPVNGVAARADGAGRSITALLGGEPSQGRLEQLIDDQSRARVRSDAPHGITVSTAKAQDVVRRARVRSALTPGACVPVLSRPAGRQSGGFPPQDLERAVARLAFRSDLVVIDTPAGPTGPVLQAALRHADQLVVVVRGDGNVDARLQAARRWAAAAPGGSPDLPVTAVVVQRGLARPQWSDPGFPVLLLRRDEGLRRRSMARLGRRSVTTALQLATTIARTAQRSRGLPVHDEFSGSAPAGPGVLMGTPPHLGGLREPLPQH